MQETFDFGHFIPISTVDWHGRSVSVLFFRGCQLRCPYCQNHAYITGGNRVSVGDIQVQIKKAGRFVSGLVFCGGEPTLQGRALKQIARYAKSLSLAVGIETNGYGVDVIEEMLAEGLLDKVFLDVKAPPGRPEIYAKVTGNGIDVGSQAARYAARTLDVCMDAGIEVEVRTTVFRGLVGAEEVAQVGRYLDERYAGVLTYAIQQGIPENTMELKDVEIFRRQELLDMADGIRPDKLSDLRIRTMENGDEKVI